MYCVKRTPIALYETAHTALGRNCLLHISIKEVGEREMSDPTSSLGIATGDFPVARLNYTDKEKKCGKHSLHGFKNLLMGGAYRA